MIDHTTIETYARRIARVSGCTTGDMYQAAWLHGLEFLRRYGHKPFLNKGIMYRYMQGRAYDDNSAAVREFYVGSDQGQHAEDLESNCYVKELLAYDDEYHTLLAILSHDEIQDIAQATGCSDTTLNNRRQQLALTLAPHMVD